MILTHNLHKEYITGSDKYENLFLHTLPILIAGKNFSERYEAVEAVLRTEAMINEIGVRLGICSRP